MTSFLKRTAQHLLAQESALHRIRLILPSRRAALFLKRELASALDKPAFAPHITTIEDFVLEQTGLEAEESAVLLFKLYESYLATTGQKQDDFATFNQWGSLLLADFNEVDRYLVDPNELFTYLSDVKRLEQWGLQPEQKSQMLQQYLVFWEQLPALYAHFTKSILGTKKVYQGLAYRQMAQIIENKTDDCLTGFDQCYFVGFNALNTAEETIMLNLYEGGKTHFLWDVDRYYFEDSMHEAGKFLRKSPLVRRLMRDETFYWLDDKLSTSSKKVEFIAAQGNNAQAVAANALLSEIPSEELQDTALVLADEQLLNPILNNLNAHVAHLNITMGLPLHQSPLSSFFEMLWQLFIQGEQRAGVNFHHSLWMRLLRHPLLPQLNIQEADIDKPCKQLETQKLVYASAEQLQLSEALTDLFFPLLGQTHKPHSAMQALLDFSLKAKELLDEQQQLTQALYGFFQLFSDLANLFEKYPYVQDFKTARQFYNQLISSEALDLYGEPLRGLQIMGMLETRTLGFKRLILTSLNEEILPAGRAQNSLIPFDIKQKFKLPTYLDKDSVYAYHFYRLLQDAEQVQLIYNNQSDGLGGGEASRFMAQLEYEWPKKNPNIEISKRSLSPSAKLDQERSEVEKTPDVVQRLQEMAQQGFSPTALSQYLKDPLEFYYERVLGVRPLEMLEDVIGYDVQGNVIHELLETFYQTDETSTPWPQINKATLSDALAAFDTKKEVQQKLVELGVSEFDSGKNLLIKEMLISMLDNFFKAEKKALEKEGQVELRALEMRLKVPFSFKDQTNIILKGTADRVEKDGQGQLRILDYKTGFVDPYKLSISDYEQLWDPAYGKAFQLCMYAYMYFKQEPAADQLSAGIISLRKLNEWILPLKINRKPLLGRDFMPDFEAFLSDLFTEMFDPSIPFKSRL
jgi:ATP-dependent helicase/nuclease subunit B